MKNSQGNVSMLPLWGHLWRCVLKLESFFFFYLIFFPPVNDFAFVSLLYLQTRQNHSRAVVLCWTAHVLCRNCAVQVLCKSPMQTKSRYMDVFFFFFLQKWWHWDTPETSMNTHTHAISMKSSEPGALLFSCSSGNTLPMQLAQLSLELGPPLGTCGQEGSSDWNWTAEIVVWDNS